MFFNGQPDISGRFHQVRFWGMTAVLFLLFLAENVYAVNVAGVNVPDGVNIGDSGIPLVLNGAGVRKKFFFKIYVGGLYLQTRQSDIQAILKDPGPKRISMHFLYEEVSKEKLIKGWNEGFENNTNEADFKNLQERLARFNTLFTDVRKGDIIQLDYLPEQTTQVWINGRLRGTIAGADFNRSLLKVWLGDKPADAELKQVMLGL